MIETFSFEASPGIQLQCRRNHAPVGAPRVVMLHGFPEAAFVWDEVMLALESHVQCVAPSLRGFAGSTAPEEVEAYKPRHTVGDVLGLLRQWAAPLDLLVAHDWGGALAWNLAAQFPTALKQLMIINSPHPATFLRELRDNAQQQAASAYMNFLCRDDAAALLAQRDFARLRGFLCRTSSGDEVRPAWLTDAVLNQYLDVWKQGLQGGLNYYRASPLKPPAGGVNALLKLAFPPEAVTVNVPTTVLWGEQDAALLPGLLDGLSQWVPQLELQRMPHASHWLVHEEPAYVVGQIKQALTR
jgi:epoxide hydrolase 4